MYKPAINPFPAVGDRVRCVQTIEETVPRQYVGKTGTVEHYRSVSRHPLIKVLFDDGDLYLLWKEELEVIDV